VSPGAPPSLHAGFAPAAKIGDYPLRRRRIHWNNWTHYVGGGGRFSWLVFGPIMAVVLAAVAVPLYLRSRLRRRRPKTVGTQAFAATVPQTDDRLKRLADLHAEGALTDEEFLTQRRRILGE
ncbi:MAG TPA: SHOCT domain-containing protein, partial [Mycobacterium sp.]|nr:SHOCT domain-containing protein [Mycobacterium sp.]